MISMLPPSELEAVEIVEIAEITEIVEVTQTALIPTIPAILVFVALLAVFLMAITKSKGIYDDFMEAVDKKEYALKDLLPVGLWLNERFRLQRYLPSAVNRHIYRYENNIKAQIMELYGMKFMEFYLVIHNGNKTTITLLVTTLAAAFAAISGGMGDTKNCGTFLLISLVALVALPLLLDRDLQAKIESRRLAIQKEFPDMVNKLMLLVNAGMTISRALEKIESDNKKDNPIYYELTLAFGEIRAGKPEGVAYEEFGRRCKIKEVVRFVSVIVQNLRKGGSEVVPVLQVQAMECWEMRKSVAKRLGEEASTKILIPLMIMFVGILMIVITPAILSFIS